MSEYDSISAQLLDVNRNLLGLAGQVGKLQGIVEAGFDGAYQRMDLTNGRVLALETDRAKTKEVDDIRAACHVRHKELTAALVDIKKNESIERIQKAHDDGERSGDAKFWAKIWLVACTVGGLFLAAWQTWPPKWWPTGVGK